MCLVCKILWLIQSCLKAFELCLCIEIVDISLYRTVHNIQKPARFRLNSRGVASPLTLVWLK